MATEVLVPNGREWDHTRERVAQLRKLCADGVLQSDELEVLLDWYLERASRISDEKRTVQRVRHIGYVQETDVILIRGGWDNYVLSKVRQMIAAGQPYKLSPVQGWGDATHHLSFTGDSESVGHLSDEFVGIHFLAVIDTTEPAEVQMTVAQVLGLIRQRQRDALEMAEWCKLNWPDDPLTARGWTGRAQELKELIEAIPGTPEAQELARRLEEEEAKAWDD